jgi:hypothetical protein
MYGDCDAISNVLVQIQELVPLAKNKGNRKK